MFLSPDWLSQRAARSPERVALIFENRVRTFAQLDAEVTQLAHVLAEHRVEPTTRVAVLMRNSDGYALLVHALARLGATLVPINTRLTPQEIAWQLNHIQCTTLIFEETHQDTAQRTATLVPQLEVADFSVLQSKIENQKSKIALQSPVSSLQSPSSILFTSGTTGSPKAALLTYNNHWSNAIASALNLGVHNDDVWLACLPLYHIGGLAILFRGIIYGNPVIIHPAFDPDAVNRAFDEQRVTIVSLVSTMLQRVLDARGDKPFPPTLRGVLLGGGPASVELLSRSARARVPVVQTYGLTEAASQVATLAPQDALRKLGSSGKPLMGLELKIEREKRVVQADEVGEIVISGPTIMREYVNDPQATERVLRDGWFHTGDLGYLDDEGYLYVLARRDDLIISGGENIYPAEIEAVLNAHPAVLESAIVGVLDREWGQAPAAYVVLREGASVSAEELRGYCLECMARFKVPIAIHFIPELPRNSAGKIQRRLLVNRS